MGSIFTGIICLRQIDIKRMVAFSSIVHMGPVLISLTLMCYGNVLGGYMIMLSHGLCSSALFYILNKVYLWLGSRRFFLLRGGICFLPVFSYFWFFFCISNIGCPPTFNFFSELFIVINSLNFYALLYVCFIFLIIVGGFYCVLMYVYFNHGNVLLGHEKISFLYLIDYLSLVIHGGLLLLFLFYMFLLMCRISFYKILICGIID